MNEKVLEVPRYLNPINDINTIIYRQQKQESETPFFGYAPSETPVRIIHCPDCGKPVSAAHLQQHREVAHTEKNTGTKSSESFTFQTNSRLVPLKPCFYSQRQNYVFTHLFEADSK